MSEQLSKVLDLPYTSQNCLAPTSPSSSTSAVYLDFSLTLEGAVAGHLLGCSSPTCVANTLVASAFLLFLCLRLVCMQPKINPVCLILSIKRPSSVQHCLVYANNFIYIHFHFIANVHINQCRNIVTKKSTS